jgi:hypothetical protein
MILLAYYQSNVLIVCSLTDDEGLTDSMSCIKTIESANMTSYNS